MGLLDKIKIRKKGKGNNAGEGIIQQIADGIPGLGDEEDYSEELPEEPVEGVPPWEEGEEGREEELPPIPAEGIPEGVAEPPVGEEESIVYPEGPGGADEAELGEAPAQKPMPRPEPPLEAPAPAPPVKLNAGTKPKSADALDELERLLGEGGGKEKAGGAEMIGGVVKVADAHEPELLRAFVELMENPITISTVDTLVGSELSLEELANKTHHPKKHVKEVMERLICLGLAEDFWYKTPSGRHINKFKFVNTRGLIEFDLEDYGRALDVETLEGRSGKLVDLVSKEGRVPKSLVMKRLGLDDVSQLEQIIRFTEKFKLPNIRESIMEEAPEIAEELVVEERLGEAPEAPVRKPGKDLSRFEAEFVELDGYMNKLKQTKPTFPKKKKAAKKKAKK